MTLTQNTKKERKRKMNIYVIGRHEGDFEGHKVIGKENVTFSLNIDEVIEKLQVLENVAVDAGADALVFQATPAILFAALYYSKWRPTLPFYAVISKPAKRESAKVFDYKSDDPFSVVDAHLMVEFLNPNAKITNESDTGFTVVVDPPMKFEFAGLYRIY